MLYKHLLLLFAATAVTSLAAQQSNTRFSHSLRTTAPPERIWQIWTDVPQWHTWDTGLQAARLDGAFALNATGRLTPDRGRSSKFKIVALEAGRSYTFRTGLPLGALYVKRTLSTEAGSTVFSHEVWFSGPARRWWGRVLGKRYRTVLPTVLQNIQTIAEP